MLFLPSRSSTCICLLFHTAFTSFYFFISSVFFFLFLCSVLTGFHFVFSYNFCFLFFVLLFFILNLFLLCSYSSVVIRQICCSCVSLCGCVYLWLYVCKYTWTGGRMCSRDKKQSQPSHASAASAPPPTINGQRIGEHLSLSFDALYGTPLSPLLSRPYAKDAPVWR